MDKGYHIVFITSNLDLPAGSERMIISLANLLVAKKYKVTLLILANAGQVFYPLDDRINIVQLRIDFGISEKGTILTRKLSLLSHLNKLKKSLHILNPTAIIATEYHFAIAAVLSVGRDFRILSWEHHHFNWIKRNKFWNFLHRKIYPRLDAVVTLNKTEQELFTNYGCRAVVIPNFVSPRQKSPLDSAALLTIGWLNWRKGTDMIPAIAEKVFSKYPQWNWKIIGKQTGEVSLPLLLKEKGLDKNVQIIEPNTSDISELYKQTSIYVMPSRFECFPMVLLEAMSLGIPCVSFNCPTGPADIIQNGTDGKLIEPENTSAMADAIIELVEDENKRKSMGASAFENIGRFSAEYVYQLWKDLLEQGV